LFYPDEYLVPLVMLAGFGCAAAGKGVIQYFEAADSFIFKPSPIWLALAAHAPI
jgi:hypothetical protein